MFFILISLLMFSPGLFSPSFAMEANLEVVNQDIFSEKDRYKLFQSLRPQEEQKNLAYVSSNLFYEQNLIIAEDHRTLPQGIRENIQTIPELLQAFDKFRQALPPEESDCFNALYNSIVRNFSALDWYDSSQEIYEEATKKIQSEKWFLLFDPYQYKIHKSMRVNTGEFIGYKISDNTPEALDMYRVFLSLHLIKNNLPLGDFMAYLKLEQLEDQHKKACIYTKIMPHLGGEADQKMLDTVLEFYGLK